MSARELVAGEVCMFDVIEWVKGKAIDIAPLLKVTSDDEEQEEEQENVAEVVVVDEVKEISRVVKAVRTMAAEAPRRAYTGPVIQHGEPITDRKSVFVGHLARVRSAQEVRQVLDELLSDKKIAKAAHNIVAWRVTDADTGSTEQVQLDSPMQSSAFLVLQSAYFLLLPAHVGLDHLYLPLSVPAYVCLITG
jgi:hypothetical protein